MTHAPQAEAAHDPRVEVGGEGHRGGNGREYQPDEAPLVEGVEDNLLDR